MAADKADNCHFDRGARMSPCSLHRGGLARLGEPYRRRETGVERSRALKEMCVVFRIRQAPAH